MTQALYRKWRPHKWAEVIGQEHIVQTLRNAITAERVAHAYLFAGPRGTGKTTSARLLAKAVNCLDADLANRPCDTCEHCVAVNQGRFLDLIEIDAASNTSVEDVRELRDKINFSPNQGRYKVYVVDEVHMLSTAAFNALLKTLEEPPAHAIFVLATTEIHKIPATILSRCQRHEFRRIPVADIVSNLKTLAQGENIQVDEAALTLIARQSAGGMRDAISLLDQLASTGQAVTLELAQAVMGAATDQLVLDVIDAVQAKDSASGLAHLHTALDGGSDPRQTARQIVDYLRQLLLIKLGNANQVDATRETRAVMARHAQNFTTPSLLAVIKAFNTAAAEARISWQPSLPLEMAFVEAITEPQAAPAPVEIAAPRVEAAPARPTAAPVQQRAVVPAEPPPAAAPTSEIGKRLNDQWRQIIQLVKQQKSNVSGLLNVVKTRHLQDNVLLLGFASDILKSQMEKPENLEVVQSVLKQVLGEDIHIRCTTVSAQRSAPPPEVEHDGMVASAVRDLGGEIVDVQ
jgi:DNA polymerase-3 subunit gamma/tau